MRIYQSLMLILFLCVLTCAMARAQERSSSPAGNAAVNDEEPIREAAAIIKRSRRGTEELGAAEHQLKKLIEQAPESAMQPILKRLLESIHEERAMHDFEVAMFHLNVREAHEAAESRLDHIINKYPSYSRLDEVLYQMGLIKVQTGRYKEAEADFNRVITDFGWTLHAKDAREQIEKLAAYR